MGKPIISIVIPAYNAGKYIEETLKSVSEQTYENWECIIVNDGSTDNTKSVVENFIQKDKNKEKFIFYSKENEGHSKTRNYGIDHSNGEYIAFLDSDDIWMSHHLVHLMNIMQSNGAGFVYSKGFLLENGNYTTRSIHYFKTQEGFLKGNKFITDLSYKNEILTPGILCKKQALLDVGKFTYNKNAEDLHLWLKLLFNNTIFFASADTTFYVRIHSSSSSNEDRFCTKDILGMLFSLKKEYINRNLDYKSVFNYWARRYFLLEDNKKHYIEAINHIHTFEPFYIFRMIAKFLPKKILKLITLQILK